MTDPVLELRGLDAGYGGVPVVRGVDLAVRPGEVLVLLGANGAGKSTTLLTVSGLLPVLGGEIRYAGTPLATGGRRPLARAAALAPGGLVHVPEDRGLFPDLTVAEHLRVTRTRDGGPSRDEVIARFPALGDLLDRRAGLLSGGEQQMLALARGLVAGPRVLLVDELSLGLAPLVVSHLLPMLREVADDTGIGVVLVEQHVRLALHVADHAVVLRRGRVALAGTADEVSARLADVEADYFGDDPLPGPDEG